MRELEDLYPKIGQAIVEFQTMDFVLNMLLMDFMARPLSRDTNLNVAASVVAVVPFKRKVDLLVECVNGSVKDDDLKGKSKECVSLLAKAEGERNRIVHTHWFRSNDGLRSMKTNVSRKKGLDKAYLSGVSEDELNGIIETIESAKLFLFEFARSLQAGGDVSINFGEQSSTGK